MLLNATQARALFTQALQDRFAVLAVNADSPSAVYDCLEAARQCSAPLIIETSLWQLQGRSFGAGDALLGLLRYLADVAALANSERFMAVPVIFHTDHIKGPQTLAILKAAIAGVSVSSGKSSLLLQASTISLDSSELTEEQNIETISELCRHAETLGVEVTLEMEAGVDDGLTSEEITRRLLGSVEKKYPGKIGLWAPGLGTQHGLSDKGYPTFSAEAVSRQRELAREITGHGIGLALHGSSGLDQESLRAAVREGVVKVNWSSESLLIRNQAAMEFFDSHRPQMNKKHPDWKKTVMDNGLQSFIAERYLPRVMERIKILGSDEKAGRLSLSGKL